MFLRPLSIKSNSKIKSSERKRLLSSVSSAFGVDTSLSHIFQSDAIYRVKFSPSVGGQVTAFIFGTLPLVIEYENRLIPTVFLLWSFPNILPHFVTHDEVVPRLISGAALMVPGVVLHSDNITPTDYGKLEKDEICSVKTVNNCAPVAVGFTALSSYDMYMSGGHGKAVTMFHVLGDQICSLGGTIPRPSIPWNSFLEMDSDSATRSIPTDTPSSSRESLTSSDEVPSLVAATDDFNDQEAVDNVEAPTASVLDQDQLLRDLFLRALRLVADKRLPLPINVFYANHVLPLKQQTSLQDLDIKRTRYKKVGILVNSLAEDGLITIDEPNAGVFFLKSVVRDHPDFRNLSTELEDRLNNLQMSAQIKNWPPGYSGPPTITESRTITGPMMPMFAAVGYRSGDSISQSEARNAVTEYVHKNKLQMVSNPSKLRVNDLLAKLLEPTSYDEAPESTLATPVYHTTYQKLFSAALKGLPLVYRISYPPKTGCQLGVTTVWRNRQPPKIHLSTMKKNGKRVTRIKNLSTFGIEPVHFARLLQSTLACSASQLEDETGSLVVQAQGNHLVALSTVLTSTYEISRKYIDGFEEPSKKKK